eukprot:gb/GEZN01002294.1/.p1 GENE.gb/GEZN01002294.1/~~gb/GEZN01002294.1/.p1  ORF type:complete len:594 (-),score=57.36 gb/GEZN01002294.1/:583-2364(-)
MSSSKSLISSLLVLAISLPCALAGEEEQVYKPGDELTIWVNKVGPYHNPQETYEYYRLPICKPKPTRKHVHNSLGAVLEGSHIEDSGLRIRFKENQDKVHICDLDLKPARAKLLSGAVKNHYWYQMYIDELPIWGMVGDLVRKTTEDGKVVFQPHVYLHKSYSISYNGDRIIQVNLTSENLKPIVSDQPPSAYPMTYSVTWTETNESFARRFDRYLDFDFFEHQIRWFSVFNSFMMVTFMCGVVALILMRVLKADYARYMSEEDDLELDRVVEESGWKLVHGDVFRPPPFLGLFAALLGTGYQLVVMVFLAMLRPLSGDTYDERGLLLNWMVFFYAVTSFISGYTGGRFYKRSEGSDWKSTMVLTALLLPGVCMLLMFFLSFLGWSYGSEAGLDFGTMLWLTMIWLILSVPLVIVGTVAGRSMASSDKPAKLMYAEVRRPIPDSQWYWSPFALALASGILPFGSIFIEMYFVFAALWNYKFYYAFGFLLMVYFILITVTICSTIVCVYFLLNGEDYRWPWTSFFSGGSTAFYVYGYAVYYFLTNTQMSGVLQTMYYFTYMAIFCFGLFMLCGTLAYTGAAIFVHKIYQQIKSD